MICSIDMVFYCLAPILSADANNVKALLLIKAAKKAFTLILAFENLTTKNLFKAVTLFKKNALL